MEFASSTTLFFNFLNLQISHFSGVLFFIIGFSSFFSFTIFIGGGGGIGTCEDTGWTGKFADAEEFSQIVTLIIL